MTALAEAFALARRHTKRERRALKNSPKSAPEDFSDLMAEAYLHDVSRSSDRNRGYDSARVARPVSVHTLFARPTFRFGQHR